jgi:hypothetical protein
MEAQELLSIVQNVSLWHGDVFKLAAMVADRQKEIDAELCETLDTVDGDVIAKAIRGQ